MSPRSNRRRRFAALFAVFLAPLCCLVPFAVNMTYNDIRLQRFAASLYNYPLPPATTVLSCHAEVGLLSGNGNHCDFDVRQVMQTELPQNQNEWQVRCRPHAEHRIEPGAAPSLHLAGKPWR